MVRFRSPLLTTSLFIAILSGLPALCTAQPDAATVPENPFGPVDELFDRFVPMPSEADERALAGIEISRADEDRLGKNMVKSYLAHLKRQQIKVRRAGDDWKYVHTLVQHLRSHMHNAERYSEINVYLVASDLPDARSFPGGTLFFYEGILATAENEAALVGVVAHELSHLDRGHQLLPLRQMRLMQQSFEATRGQMDPWKFLESGTRTARLMSRPFRPQDEAAADRDAATWSYAAGYDSREFSRLLIRLHQKWSEENPITLPAFLRTHPPTLERAEAVLEQFHAIRNKADPPRYIGATNLKRRIPRSEREFLE